MTDYPLPGPTEYLPRADSHGAIAEELARLRGVLREIKVAIDTMPPHYVGPGLEMRIARVNGLLREGLDGP